MVSGYWDTATVNCLVQSDKATAASINSWMDDRISMSISGDKPSDETLNRDRSLALLLRRQHEFPIKFNIVQYSFFQILKHYNLFVIVLDNKL